MQAKLYLKIQAALGEGAIWHHKRQELWWVDIEGKKLYIYHLEKNINRVIDVRQRIGTVVPVEDENAAIVALQDGLYLLDLASEEMQLVTSPEKHLAENRFNDGKCDPAGRLWVGSMHLETKENAASLYKIDHDGKAHQMLPKQTICNGIVWTSDRTTMYYIDTATRKIRSYDYDNITGNISNEKTVVEVPSELGFPDGMAIDEKDKLWVAHYGGACVCRWDPLNGNLLQKIEVPALNVTSCAFGGKDLKNLFITTASIDMSAWQKTAYPDAGCIFLAETEVKGTVANFFKRNF